MIRSVIFLIIGAIILTFVTSSNEQIPLFLVVLMWFFGLLCCFLAWGSIRHHTSLRRARKTTPVTAEIFVRSTENSDGSDYLVAEITVNDETWRGSLTGWNHERELANQTSDGVAWLAPKTGAPLEFQIKGKIFTPVPIVVKVNENSKLEKLIRRVHEVLSLKKTN